jgi:hypothetical protein
MYLQAIFQTMRDMGPQYLINIYKWVKCAIWDAPFRVYLDVELEKNMIERNLSRDDDDEDESHSD